MPLFLRRFWTLKRECSELHDRWKGRKRPRKVKINFISRCSKLFYTISRCSFHIESTLSGASVSFVFSHIARYVPSPEENSCIPITHFQCKKIILNTYLWNSRFAFIFEAFLDLEGNVASYTTDERAENDQKKVKINFISRCSKLFYIISRCYFHIESTFSGASVSFVFSHIARYVPSPEENSCIPITHFQCKNNFEHLLMKFKICLYFWGVSGPWRGNVASYTTDERSKRRPKRKVKIEFHK